jgi:hypothetical protein
MLATIPIRSRGDCIPLEPAPAPAALPGARWYVGVTAPRMERIAQDQCSRAGVPTFLPLKELPPEDPRACAPLFPGYLFLCAAALPTGVTAARGVVSTAAGPIICPRGLVERIMGDCDEDGLHKKHRFTPAQPPRFAVGDLVRIDHGPLMGAFGTIARVNGHHLRVELHHFLGNAPVDLRTEQVSRID